MVSTNKSYYDDYNLIYEIVEYVDVSTDDVRKIILRLDLQGSYETAGTGGLCMMEINGELCYAFKTKSVVLKPCIGQIHQMMEE